MIFESPVRAFMLYQGHANQFKEGQQQGLQLIYPHKSLASIVPLGFLN